MRQLFEPRKKYILSILPFVTFIIANQNRTNVVEWHVNYGTTYKQEASGTLHTVSVPVQLPLQRTWRFLALETWCMLECDE